MQYKNKKTENLAKIVGDVIKEYRQKNNYSITKFAYEYGLDAGNISRLENGKIEVKLVTLWKIAEALNIKPSDIVKSIEKNIDKEFKLIEE